MDRTRSQRHTEQQRERELKEQIKPRPLAALYQLKRRTELVPSNMGIQDATVTTATTLAAAKLLMDEYSESCLWGCWNITAGRPHPETKIKTETKPKLLTSLSASKSLSFLGNIHIHH